MLHHEALPSGTLDLLKLLAEEKWTENFALAAGTSLALRFGHRISIDLDFFTTSPFDSLELSKELSLRYPTRIMAQSNNAISAVVRDVKVDFVTYRYPLLKPVELIEGVRFLSLEDVTAMKFAELTNRGSKKDFYDADLLIAKLGLAEVLGIYMQKFPNHDPLIVLRSLTYFFDAESEPAPESLAGQTWPSVKNRVSQSVRTIL